MYKALILIILLGVSLSFMSFSFFKKKERDYEQIANEISANVAKKLVKKHKMNWIGEGGGMMGSVYMIGLHFQIHHPLNREEARERILDCVEELLAAVNSNQEIRPFLKNYPFTTKNVQVSIISNNKGKDVFDPDIRVVSVFENDEIIFRTKEPNKVPYKNVYRESYSEALSSTKNKKTHIPNN